jgi:vancomycin permeability regulator SanA
MSMRIIRASIIVCITGAVIVLQINESIWSFGRGITPVHTAQQHDVALIFGGGMRSDGTMTKLQKDRVLTGVDIYEEGKAQMLIMTGDDGSARANEVDAMKALAIKHGVPTSSIQIDPSSFRTYLSCYRARHEYDIEKALVVSQNFHIPRIRYLCGQMGIDTIGVSADRQKYRRIQRAYIREVFANVKAWWQAQVSRPDDAIRKDDLS